jgi:hypothetical protein
MTTHDSLLAQGIAAAKAGDKATARRLLTRAARRDAGSEATWLWLSSVLDTPQARAFCLRRVLDINPDNEAAHRGLTLLVRPQPAPVPITEPAPVIAVQQPPVAAARPAPTPQPRRLGHLLRQQRFWQIVVACLAVVALGLGAALAYPFFREPATADEEALAVVAPSTTPAPFGTLRPTFTATPTWTPIPTLTPMPMPSHTPILTLVPSHTPTFTPTSTETLTPTATTTPLSPRRAAAATATRKPTPRPTLAPRRWDPRLEALGVRIEPAAVAPGQSHWRLVEARWTNERESGGKHSIYVEAVGAHGNRLLGQPVTVEWSGHSLVLPVEDRPAPDWAVNFPMYSTLGSYSVRVGGAPSDRIVGLGLGTAETPFYTVHTCFYLTFRLVQR